MDAERFRRELPGLFDDFPRTEHPRDRRFAAVVERIENLTSENVLALLNLAASCVEPGESYVDFQLSAHRMRPNDFVVVMGYGESAPGFVPPEQAWVERDSNLNSWCWIDPGSEKPLKDALRKALVASPP